MNNDKTDSYDVINNYSNMSEEALMQELLRVGSCSSGQVTTGELDNFFNKVSAFLTPEQRSRMKELIIMLKRN